MKIRYLPGPSILDQLLRDRFQIFLKIRDLSSRFSSPESRANSEEEKNFWSGLFFWALQSACTCPKFGPRNWNPKLEQKTTKPRDVFHEHVLLTKTFRFVCSGKWMAAKNGGRTIGEKGAEKSNEAPTPYQNFQVTGFIDLLFTIKRNGSSKICRGRKAGRTDLKGESAPVLPPSTAFYFPSKSISENGEWIFSSLTQKGFNK